MIKKYDYIIYGAGIFGLYLAYSLGIKFPSKKILILEYDSEPFSRSSFVNQARVHNGYHYPRSLQTAISSSHYYTKFNEEFSFAINNKFTKIYSISSDFSYASAKDFLAFCKNANIPCQEVIIDDLYNENMIETSFKTEETSLDSKLISKYLCSEISKNQNCEIIYNARTKYIEQKDDTYIVELNDQRQFATEFLINSTYASINQIINKLNYPLFDVQYELAEMVLCEVSENIKDIGITVMDGLFFSLMPFGLTGLHSLSSVISTPHKTSSKLLPSFSCQQINTACSPLQLENCNTCIAKPSSNFIEMNQLCKKYLSNNVKINYNKSLFTVKTILKSSEVNDSRPTVIKCFSTNPVFISVLSGKINTMYDLVKEVLEW